MAKVSCALMVEVKSERTVLEKRPVSKKTTFLDAVATSNPSWLTVSDALPYFTSPYFVLPVIKSFHCLAVDFENPVDNSA